jgi:hypothetical protein
MYPPAVHGGSNSFALGGQEMKDTRRKQMANLLSVMAAEI